MFKRILKALNAVEWTDSVSMSRAVADALKTEFADLDYVEQEIEEWHDYDDLLRVVGCADDLLDEVRRHRAAHLELVESGTISASRSAELLGISMPEWRRTMNTE